MASSTESETNQISSDEHLTQIIDLINEDTNIDESTPRTSGQTAIGAKLVKKLETLGIFHPKFFIEKFFSSSR